MSRIVWERLDDADPEPTLSGFSVKTATMSDVMSGTTVAEHGIFAPWPFVLGVPHALWVERTLYKVARDGRLLDDALGPRRHSRVGWAKRKRKRARRKHA